MEIVPQELEENFIPEEKLKNKMFSLNRSKHTSGIWHEACESQV